MSLKEVLDSYKHIELSEDEINEAMIWAKRKKEAKLEELGKMLRAQEARKTLTSTMWGYEQTKGFMKYRAERLFDSPFEIDENNEAVFNLLCYYFSADPEFESVAMGMGINNPSLKKGILLCGNYGSGKSWMMRLFQKNKRQVYHMHQAKELSILYKKLGEEALEQFNEKHKNAYNDAAVFYQPFAGICIDDIGAEDFKANYGDKKNVIGDLIEGRYVNDLMGIWFHGTTNFTAKQIEEYYSGRVVDRLRECVNFIELPGRTRRK